MKHLNKIAIVSGKGGVGKSNLSANLAYQIGMLKQKVLLFDADYGLSNVELISGMHVSKSLADYLKGSCEFDDLLVPLSKRVSFISSGSADYFIANMGSKAMDLLLYKVQKYASNYDSFIIDTGAGLNEKNFHTMKLADHLIIITTPEPASLTDSYASIKMVMRRRVPMQFSVVVNRVDSSKLAHQTFQRLDTVCTKYLSLDLNYLGAIPEDSCLQLANNNRILSSLAFPSAKSTLAIKKMANKILNQNYSNMNQEQWSVSA